MDLRAQRRAAGPSRSQLAQSEGIPHPSLSAYENGQRSPSPRVLDRIEGAQRGRPSARVAEHRDHILAMVEEHRATVPRLFGSVARGEDQPDSDVDLLVDFTGEATLLDEVELRLALRNLLQVEVDVVAADTLRGDLRERVLREAVPV